MSKFGDKIKSVFTMDYNDEYGDDYYDDIDDEIEEEIDHPTPSRRSAAKAERQEEEEAPRSTTHTRSRAAQSIRSSRSSRNSKVVPMRGSSSGTDMEVCVIKPTHYETTKEIIDTLLDGKSVVLNLEGIKIDLAQRIVDSVIGGCYAISGNLQKISGYIYLVTPHSVDITGDFQDSVNDSTSDYSSHNYSSRGSY